MEQALNQAFGANGAPVQHGEPLIRLAFASGEDSLSVRRFTVEEAMSSLFTVSLWARSRREDLDLEGLVGDDVTVAISAAAGGALRTYKGVCSFIELTQTEPSGLSTYYVRVVPKLWLLTQRRDSRLFQHMTVIDMVDAVLDAGGIERIWDVDRAAYPKLELRVQYEETDHAFVCRMLEEAGISYFFSDEGKKGTVLLLSDEPHLAEARAGGPIPFVDSPTDAPDREHVTAVRMSHEVRPGKVTIRDHDFRNPELEVAGQATAKHALEPRHEQYDHAPGAFVAETGKGEGTPVGDNRGHARADMKRGAGLAQMRLDAARVSKRRVIFGTNALDLAPGTVFTMGNHPRQELGPQRKLLVIEAQIEGTVTGDWSAMGHAVFADTPYRPQALTPKPRIHGVQGAVVVGPPGKEVHCDEYGRVRVHFHWDRSGTRDDGSSCWMRVSQGWAGAGFGMVAIPRIGQEVLVGFLDGDPDQPLVVGRVYDRTRPAPYELPDNMTITALRTRSTPGTGGHNELSFEDAKDRELVYMRAERNLSRHVRKDEVARTENNHVVTVGGNQDLVVKKVKKELVHADSHLHVRGDLAEATDGSQSLTVGKDHHARVGESHAVEAGRSIHLRAGDHVVIEAGSRLTLKGPGGFVDIDDAGVTIRGTVVKINSGGSAGSGGGSSPAAPRDAVEAVVETPGQKGK